jgi:hypothetical protein
MINNLHLAEIFWTCFFITLPFSIFYHWKKLEEEEE